MDGFMLEDELGDESRMFQATWRFTVNWQRESLLLPRMDGGELGMRMRSTIQLKLVNVSNRFWPKSDSLLNLAKIGQQLINASR